MFVDPAENMHYSSYFEQVCAGDLGTNAQLLEEWLYHVSERRDRKSSRSRREVHELAKY